ncbi:MAG: pyruvate ferredoxin oxidoreductase, partial [Candidatus Bathyarchaeia archaeon]
AIHVATPALYPPMDFVNKVRKAFNSGGPAFIQVLTPCPKGWFFDPKHTVTLSRLAVETGAWALWEYEEGAFSLTYKPPKRRDLAEYMRLQGRFTHLSDEDIERLDRMIEEQWGLWLESDRQKRLILSWTPPPTPL